MLQQYTRLLIMLVCCIVFTLQPRDLGTTNVILMGLASLLYLQETTNNGRHN